AGVLAQAGAGAVPPLPASVPEPLRRVVERATRARPEDRFAAALQMHQALDAFVVAERSARPEMPAPSQLLAEWLRRLFDRGEDEGRGEPPPADGGPEITFVDDGEKELLRGWGGGAETMRSMAETVGEDDVVVPPRPPVRRGAWPWIAVGAGAIAAAAIAVVA